MQSTTLTLSLILIFFACSSCSDDDDTLRNTDCPSWRLVAQLSDPGDGSGTFQPISSSRLITFLNDTTFTVNGNPCLFNSDTGPTTMGSFNASTGNLTLSDCASIGPLRMVIDTAASELIVYFPCFEPCAQKYRLDCR